jgi:hypothetical protein
MLGTKNGEGNRKEEPAKRHIFVHTMLLRQFPENFDEADDENQQRTNVHPECRRRHSERGGNQTGYDNNELLAHDDLQRWALLRPILSESGLRTRSNLQIPTGPNRTESTRSLSVPVLTSIRVANSYLRIVLNL